MTEIIIPGAGLLFMKVGTHAQETLEDIIARKSKEIDDAGFAMWDTAEIHATPRTMVATLRRDFQAAREANFSLHA